MQRPTEDVLIAADTADILCGLLSHKQQQAVILCGEGYLQREAAGMLGVSQQAVSYRLQRAKRAIALYEDGETL